MRVVSWHRIRRGGATMAALLAFLALPAIGQEKQGLRETAIRVDGMICSSCTAAVEQALYRLAGVAQARADLKEDTVRVKYDGEKVTPRQMAEAIRKAGYQARWPAEKAPR